MPNSRRAALFLFLENILTGLLLVGVILAVWVAIVFYYVN